MSAITPKAESRRTARRSQTFTFRHDTVVPLGADQMAIGVGRRQFITAIGGAAFVWPLAAHAQQPEQMRRVGMLFGIAADDPNAQAEYAAFLQGLQQLGWTEGRVSIERRWAGGNAAAVGIYAAELVARAPDVILSVGSAHCGAIGSRRPVACRSYLSSPLIRSAPAMSIVCRGRAATLPAL